MKATIWQKEYKEKKFYWELKPEKGLKEVLKHTPQGIALDIGAGEGRNSIFLVKNGFEVEAIDKVKECLEKCKRLAKRDNLPIKTRVIDIRKFNFKKNKYTLIVAIASLDFLKVSEIKKIISKIKKSLKKEGVFYLLVFSTKDPAFKKCKRNLEEVERNTFYLSKFKTHRHFFEKKELLNLLKDFETTKVKEEKLKDIHNDKPYFHRVIKIIAIKKKEA